MAQVPNITEVADAALSLIDGKSVPDLGNGWVSLWDVTTQLHDKFPAILPSRVDDGWVIEDGRFDISWKLSNQKLLRDRTKTHLLEFSKGAMLSTLLAIAMCEREGEPAVLATIARFRGVREPTVLNYLYSLERAGYVSQKDKLWVIDLGVNQGIWVWEKEASMKGKTTTLTELLTA